jgi:hypothetical protein
MTMQCKTSKTNTSIKISIHEKELCLKLVIYKDYTEMHGQQNVKFCNEKQAKLTHQAVSSKPVHQTVIYTK